MALPRLISVDDHVVEPPDLWKRHLPTRHRGRGPRVERVKGKVRGNGRHFTFPEREDGYWADRWVYGDETMPITSGFVAVCFDRDDVDNRAVRFDDLLPGCTDPAARIADMDANHVDASLCFPTFPRFCGQTFLEGADKDLGLACVRAYNDWMIDEWCGGQGHGSADPAHAPAAVGRAAGGGRGRAVRGRRAATPSASARGRRRWACRACTPTTGTRCGRRARRPTPS